MSDHIAIELEGKRHRIWIPPLTEPEEVMAWLAEQRAANLVTALQEVTMWAHRLPRNHELQRTLTRWIRLARGEAIHRMTH